MAGKASGPIPEAVKRRRNADELKPIAQGTRRGVTIRNAQPSPHWRQDVRNYFNSALHSGQYDWWENSDLMTWVVHCELLDRVLRGSRTEEVFETDEVDYEDKDGRWQTRYVTRLDEDGNPIPKLDEYGEQERRLIGSVNGQALKAVLDMGSELLITEGSRRRLRIDLGTPSTDEEDEAARIVADQRKRVGKVTPIKRGAN